MRGMGRIQYAMRLQTVAMAASGEFGAGCSRPVAARRKVPACSKLGLCCRQSLLGCGRALPSQKRSRARGLEGEEGKSEAHQQAVRSR